MADYIPIYSGALRLTLIAGAAITGGQLVYISASGQVSPTTAATDAWVGVAAFDQPIVGQPVTVLAGGGVQLLAASGTITAGAAVCAATGGAVAAFGSGTDYNQVVGIAVTAPASGQLQVLMRR
ncbi:DUF2190 domain-containing protein [Nocardia sp. NPDC046763]|uniref:capsid cement protein n=1 Tax=Nocardia sp. NPDC046763 TaxID=3155256 RepID=UPI0033F8739A